ncbi:MAG TPA: tetratricopeptide repeat protein [Rhizomicrobium sp.]|jgi:Flp pilus assembly protein TadD|nr:tetratricopeptide repeat protein [Rhizomicrobium sp.]
MRFAPSLASLLLCGSVLAGCASDNNGVLGNIGQHKNVSASTGALPSDVDSGVRQAQQARLAGRYDDAIHTLSQLMLLASDDPRVVGEYGKALVEKGRAQEAVQFLTRATELQPRDWTVYSALGVAYDEAGDQISAGRAYEHALALKPGEPAILNNYALSRMLASDPAMARQLIASAASAGGASDPKIAHNIALVNSLAALAPTPVAQAAQPPQALAAKAPAVDVASRAPTPAALPAVPAVSNPQVVMQAVPADPLAGPVKSHPKPQAKPVTPDDKTAKAADAKSAAPKAAIPDLRQTALNY